MEQRVQEVIDMYKLLLVMSISAFISYNALMWLINSNLKHIILQYL